MSLELWEKVCTTDPKYTKGFTRGGGFSGTAVNATYLIRRATELWGPLGGKWGYKVLESEFVPSPAGEVIHVVRIEFRHPEGAFETFGQTTFCGKNKNGQFTDEEAPKKSLTDAITKALSMLGFASDIHLGLYDDNKYVAEVKKQFSETERKIVEADVKPAAGVEDYLSKDERFAVDEIANAFHGLMKAKDYTAALDLYRTAKKDWSAEEDIYFCSAFPANVRRFLKEGKIKEAA